MRMMSRTLVVLSLGLMAPWALADDPIPITTAPLRDWTFHPVSDAPAVVISLKQTRIPAELNARLVQLNAEVGDEVKAGDELARLDCVLFDNALRQARASGKALDAQIRLAGQQLSRARELVKQRNASKELVDQREADISRLRADRDAQAAVIASAGKNVDHCRIEAPFDGVITERHLSIGAYVTGGASLFTLIDPDAVELEADVPYELLPSLRRANSINFDKTYPVTFRVALPTVSTSTGQQAVRLSFLTNRRLAGITGRIRWQSPDLAVPAELLVRRQGDLGIFIVRDGEAVFHAMKNALEGRPGVVELPADTLLIIDGREAVIDGRAIRVVQSD